MKCPNVLILFFLGITNTSNSSIILKSATSLPCNFQTYQLQPRPVVANATFGSDLKTTIE